jgi:hypothetical protein
MVCFYSQSEKKVSAVAISQDGEYVTFADKFGLVWIVSLKEDRDRKAVPILGHYCSIITSMVLLRITFLFISVNFVLQ